MEVWGTEDGDRIDVSTYEDGSVEVFARFDLRHSQPTHHEQFLAFVRGVDGRLHVADTKAEVTLTPEAFQRTLAESRAADFVRDPAAYLRRLKERPNRVPEEP